MVTWVNGTIGPMPRCACGCRQRLSLAHIGRQGRPRRYLGPQHRYRAQLAERRDPGCLPARETRPVTRDLSPARIDAIVAQAQVYLRWQRQRGTA